MTCARRAASVRGDSVVRKPSAIVVVGGSGSTLPETKLARGVARIARLRAEHRVPFGAATSLRSTCPTAGRRRRRARSRRREPCACSSSSSAAVPCPAITRASSNGWISVAPVSRCTSSHAASRAATIGAQRRMSRAEAADVVLLDLRRVVRHHDPGRNAAALRRVGERRAVIARRMRDDAACGASASASENTALQAPRALNAPIRWKFSHLKKSVAPTSASIASHVRTGVRWMCGAMRACAARIAARSGRQRLRRQRRPALRVSCRAARGRSGKKKSFHESGFTLIAPDLAP